MPKLRFTPIAQEDLLNLQNDSSKKIILKAVLKTLALMENNLKHPSLKTHEYKNYKGPNNEKLFEAYAQIVLLAPIEYFGTMDQKKT